ncbi:MAG: hypothetical protein JKY65_16330, partial [Planctomycetes bacterium]|nr:hypothetical protein [Planctomycetota bacterium]
MNRSILLALALGLLGCQASTPAASAPPEALLFTSAIDPSSADVERSIAQLARLDAVACRATRLALLPDLAHELFVRSPQASLRAEAVAALKDPGYRASQAARAAPPEAHDRLRAAFVTWIEDQVGDAVDLRSGFEALGDSVLACEVAQRARARGLPLKRPTATVAIQRARAAWHELAAATRQGEPRPDLIEAALNAARAQQHLGVLEGIEQLCAASAVLLSPDERTRLSLDRARIALLRHDGARALRAAVVPLLRLRLARVVHDELAERARHA